MAALAVESGLAFREALRAVSRPLPGLIARNSERVKAWEEKADERLNRIRKLHQKDPQPLLPLAGLVDDALDALEDAADLALAIDELLKDSAKHEELVAAAEEGAELALKSAQLFLKVLHQYSALVRGGAGEELFDTIDELKQTENQGDKLKRACLWKFLSTPEDSRFLFALRGIQERLEEAMNALSRAGFLVHDLAYRAMERNHG
jgi:uncharacterized protein Yka (UPF0111/DUF47 family)